MLYRLITLIGGLVFVAALFALVWFFCKKFLQHHGVTDQTSDRATVLATWTFAGIAIGWCLRGGRVRAWSMGVLSHPARSWCRHCRWCGYLVGGLRYRGGISGDYRGWLLRLSDAGRSLLSLLSLLQVAQQVPKPHQRRFLFISLVPIQMHINRRHLHRRRQHFDVGVLGNDPGVGFRHRQ